MNFLSRLPSVDPRRRFDADTMPLMFPDGRVGRSCASMRPRHSGILPSNGEILPLCRPHASGKVVGKWLRHSAGVRIGDWMRTTVATRALGLQDLFS